MGSPTVKSLATELDELRAQISALTERLSELSKVAAAETVPPAPAVPVAVPAPVEISEEILIALSAAVAAYLGKRAPIRHVRLLGTTAWAQQGRVNIQASHGLNVQHSK